MSARFARYIVIWLLILATLWIGERFIRTALLTADEPRAVAPRGPLSALEEHTIEVFEAVAPSVVFIVTEAFGGGPFGSGATQVGAGSGFFWDGAGHVVTNNHVVSGARRVLVRVASGETVSAEVIGTAPDYDLAVLRLASGGAERQPIAIGSSEDLKVGQTTFAIGNPFGLSRSLTTGVISALDRRLPTASHSEIRGVIQTDAAINPGNSGGPLLDSAGRLIGVNTAILSQSGAFAGIGFAVPVDVVNRVVPQLIATGRVARPGIGITALPEEFNAQLGVDGVVIDRVLPGSTAEAAGLQGVNRTAGRLGDIITHVDGERVETVSDLSAALQDEAIGDEVELTLNRNGETRTMTVTVMDIS